MPGLESPDHPAYRWTTPFVLLLISGSLAGLISGTITLWELFLCGGQAALLYAGGAFLWLVVWGYICRMMLGISMMRPGSVRLTFVYAFVLAILILYWLLGCLGLV